jgi:hypothetical protein
VNKNNAEGKKKMFENGNAEKILARSVLIKKKKSQNQNLKIENSFLLRRQGSNIASTLDSI